MPYQFSPPTIQVGYSGQMPSAGYRLFRRMKLATGQTLLKNGAFYTLLSEPGGDVFDAADIAYLGGHTYTVDDVEAAALTAAGYGSGLSDVVVPPPDTPPDDGDDPVDYGLGSYGTGFYGR